MAALGTLIALLALAARAHSASFSLSQRADEDFTLNLEPQLTGGFQMVLLQGDERNVLGQIGRNFVGNTYTIEKVDDGFRINVGGANLTVNRVQNDRRLVSIEIEWEGGPGLRIEDCHSFGNKHWYGGPMQVNQVYPIERAERVYSPYYTKEDDNGAIVERYWLNSEGEYIYIFPDAPLFVDYHNSMNNSICLSTHIVDPYSSKRPLVTMKYIMHFLPDAKQAHQHAVENYLGKPSGLPDYRMVQHPIWSTWAQYSRDINENNVLEFAQQIRDNGFNNSQFEIDDLWEVCYGSLTVDETKFPNFTKTVEDLKALGYRVTIWVHPFINQNCEPWYSEALENDYLVLNEEGSPDTTWWNSNGTVAGYIDFTNTAAANWFYQRVKTLIDTYDIDSLKFDAGESSFTPQIAVQNGDIYHQPHHIVEAYVKTCARFGNMIEVRTGFRTQELPIFVRMVDRDSIWGINNGLPTIITTTFQMNLNGYTLVLPDMIGGNGYNLDHDQADLPTKELFIRWVQANTFLPAMQYSFAPWNFDSETVEISRKYTELHAAYADEIYAAMQASVSDGTPVNAPLWWLDPQDPDALVISDEYLLGEDIVVAPVLVEGAVSRDVYLPVGTWLAEGDPARRYEGPLWLRNYPAPLDVLPYFVREKEELTTAGTDAATAPAFTAFLVLSAIIVNYLNAL